jgi:hypothetical protein
MTSINLFISSGDPGQPGRLGVLFNELHNMLLSDMGWLSPAIPGKSRYRELGILKCIAE